MSQDRFRLRLKEQNMASSSMNRKGHEALPPAGQQPALTWPQQLHKALCAGQQERRQRREDRDAYQRIIMGKDSALHELERQLYEEECQHSTTRCELFNSQLQLEDVQDHFTSQSQELQQLRGQLQEAHHSISSQHNTLTAQHSTIAEQQSLISHMQRQQEAYISTVQRLHDSLQHESAVNEALRQQVNNLTWQQQQQQQPPLGTYPVLNTINIPKTRRPARPATQAINTPRPFSTDDAQLASIPSSDNNNRRSTSSPPPNLDDVPPPPTPIITTKTVSAAAAKILKRITDEYKAWEQDVATNADLSSPTTPTTPDNCKQTPFNLSNAKVTNVSCRSSGPLSLGNSTSLSRYNSATPSVAAAAAPSHSLQDSSRQRLNSWGSCLSQRRSSRRSSSEETTFSLASASSSSSMVCGSVDGAGSSSSSACKPSSSNGSISRVASDDCGWLVVSEPIVEYSDLI